MCVLFTLLNCYGHKSQVVIDTGWMNVFDRLNAAAVILPGNTSQVCNRKKAEVNVCITRDRDKEQHSDIGTIFFIRGWQVTVSNLNALITHCQLDSPFLQEIAGLCVTERRFRENTLWTSSKFFHTSKVYKVNCWSL